MAYLIETRISLLAGLIPVPIRCAVTVSPKPEVSTASVIIDVNTSTKITSRRIVEHHTHSGAHIVKTADIVT
jgi:hypothetical protein